VRILVRHPGGWRAVDPRAYSNEDELQRLLKESPEIIPRNPPDLPGVAYCREFPVGNYAIDLVGVGSDGSVSLIECKLANNREAKRTVVGQILEYAAGVWRMDLATFEAAFTARNGRSPLEELHDQSIEGHDESACRERLSQNLARGRFRLVIAVDHVTPELRGIIEYVNHQPGDLRLVALDLPYFADPDVAILVPETFGDELTSPQGPEPLPIEWDEATFLASMAERPGEADVARDLLKWAATQGLLVVWGRGHTFPTVRILLDAPERPYPLLAIWASGTVELKFGDLKARPITDDSSLRAALLDRLNEIPGVSLPADAADRYPSVHLAVFMDDDAIAAFKGTWEWAIAQVRGAMPENP
jgi:hypothetical protein